MKKITLYHGTSESSAQNILKDGINFNLGSGELGKGFYLGTSIAYASCMAWHAAQKNNDSKFHVLSVTIKVDDLKKWNVLSFNNWGAERKWNELIKTNQTKTYLFNKDVVISPVQDGLNMGCWQFKFEKDVNPKLKIKTFRSYEQRK